ncbi:MAG: hypothetical protein HOJ16_08650 [Candidatus Peribacter sp.]|jgi:hypothetical protein|nr:hypothetical protein [Candidatus Peribacter sp.]
MSGRKIFNSSLNSVGHRSGPADNIGPGYVPADDGFANTRFWQIDLHHIATGKCVQFKSFLTQFEDRWKSDFKSVSVYGRMDPIQIFQGTQRVIELGWSVPSVSVNDAQANLHSFEHLSSMLYPTYEVRKNNLGQTIRTMSSSPVMKIKFANLVQDVRTNTTSPSAVEGGLVGTVSGFSMKPNLDMGFFNPAPGILYPKEFELSCTFTVLHSHALGWNEDNINWLGDDAGATNYAYGVHPMTGDHSICKDTRKAKPANKAASEKREIVSDSEVGISSPDAPMSISVAELNQSRLAEQQIFSDPDDPSNYMSGGD